MPAHSRFEKGCGLMNYPVPSFGLRVEVPDVLRNAIIADCFEIPAASVLVPPKRRLRRQTMSSHGYNRSPAGRMTGWFAPCYVTIPNLRLRPVGRRARLVGKASYKDDVANSELIRDAPI
jgi:hypothetical protein